MIELKKPSNGEIVNILTEKQIEFLKIDRSGMDSDDIDYLNLIRQEVTDYSIPEGIVFEWESSHCGEETLQISEDDKFTAYISKSAAGTCTVENLKGNTRYFWRVAGSNGISDAFYFDTADMFPRFVKIDGVSNVRDCGGWKTVSGKRIKQGILYRGGEMNRHLTITDNGLDTMRETLKIKSVLDLRSDSELPCDVYGGNYINIPVTPYIDWFDYPDTMNRIFCFLSKSENYPVYYHCWGGADRTGTLSFLLGALLGMKYDDLLDDYESSSFSIWGFRSRNDNNFKGFIDVFVNRFKGDNLEEKAKNYMLSCKITEEMIDGFKKIMLE